MSAIVASMTGFARVEGRTETPIPFSWIWEAKSVNSRGLDVRVRLPHGFDAMEMSARNMVAKVFKRGALTLSLTLTTDSAAGDSAIDETMLQSLIELARKTTQQLGGEVVGREISPASLDGLMGMALGRESSGPLDPAAKSERDALLISSLNDALEALTTARRKEGAELLPVIQNHLDRIESLCMTAGKLAAVQPDRLKSKLTETIHDLTVATPQISEDRLAQEIALLAVKFDIREELDRLNAHVTQARELLNKGGACGRRLDFLCQEFNREANTVCSKSSDIELTRIGLDLKSTIDQLREQIQNIE